MSKIKRFFIGACIIIVVFGVGVCGGYIICNKNWSKRTDSSASTNIREQLTATSESLKTAESSLESANNRVTELESVINGAINSTEQNNKLIADAQITSENIGDSVEGITELFTEYTRLVEQLQANNIELTNRLKSSVGETTGQQ